MKMDQPKALDFCGLCEYTHIRSYCSWVWVNDDNIQM